METERKFWMVWAPQGHAPTKKHQTREAAEAEAERLATMHIGQSFFVLKSVCGMRAVKPLVLRIDMVYLADDDLPF